MRVTRHCLTFITASLLVCGSMGCVTGPDKNLFSKKPSSGEASFLDHIPFLGKSEKTPEPYPNPVKLAVTWTPDTIIQTGRTPTRGFGGRVFFYDDKSKSVPVEGTLVVHGCDDSGSQDSTNSKRFEFTPEQFTRHFSQSDLGASYSIWIPWDAMGGQQKRISLVTSFKSTAGKPIQGIPATMMLPGSSPERSESDEIARLSPQYQRYVQAMDTGSRKTGLTTTTIRRHNNIRGEQFDTSTPAITIPEQQSGIQIAGGQSTPSLNIDRLNKPSRSNVMPVSAQSAGSRR